MAVERAARSPRDERILAWLCRWLTSTYEVGRRGYSLSLPEPTARIVRAASAESDGEGGSALLTEVRHWLGPAGEDVMRRREVFKELLLLAIRRTKLPWFEPRRSNDRAWLLVRLKPRKVEPSALRLLKRTLQGRLPDELAQRVLDYSSWYAHGKLHALPTARRGQENASIDCGVEPPAMQRLLRRALNYPAYTRCKLTFAHASPVAVEWCRAGRKIWLVAEDLWPLVELLRYLRDLRGGQAEFLHLHGYGDVLV